MTSAESTHARPSIAKGNERLLRLADFLEALPRKRFDYGVFIGDDWKGAPDLSCGTTACAIGWATVIPEFRALGLKMDQGGVPIDTKAAGRLVHERIGSVAGRRIFALTEEESSFLFLPGTWIDGRRRHAPGYGATPKMVAKHIRRFVKERA